jgi:N-acetylmuramoyl-L-alanine amidase
VVVLDPGHGGHDVGATGADGAFEKSVNLALALDVRERLEALGGYQVIMTRDDDRFVELEDRVFISRRVSADLLISIHADADPGSRSTHGASVYTLDYNFEHRSDEILEQDPRILDVDLTSRSEDVSEILVDLVQSDTGPLVGNTHRRGNLKVLLAPDVPAVLVEAGFMTNSRDEARLTSRADRGALADAIVQGVEEYFEQRERLYAAR